MKYSSAILFFAAITSYAMDPASMTGPEERRLSEKKRPVVKRSDAMTAEEAVEYVQKLVDQERRERLRLKRHSKISEQSPSRGRRGGMDLSAYDPFGFGKMFERLDLGSSDEEGPIPSHHPRTDSESSGFLGLPEDLDVFLTPPDGSAGTSTDTESDEGSTPTGSFDAARPHLKRDKTVEAVHNKRPCLRARTS